MWPDGLMKGLDGASESAVMKVTGRVFTPIHTNSVHVFDFKGEHNIHSYKKLKGGRSDLEFHSELLSCGDI